MKFSINNFTNTNFDRNIKFQKVIKCISTYYLHFNAYNPIFNKIHFFTTNDLKANNGCLKQLLLKNFTFEA